MSNDDNAPADDAGTIPKSWRFGPWAPELAETERVARCRAMRAVARLIAGPRSQALQTALRVAEADPWWAPHAVSALNAMAPLDQRRILSSYDALR